MYTVYLCLKYFATFVYTVYPYLEYCDICVHGIPVPEILRHLVSLHAHAVGVVASEEGHSGSGTGGLHVVVGQLHSLTSQPVQVRCVHVVRVPTDVTPPEVVSHDVDDVRLLAG